MAAESNVSLKFEITFRLRSLKAKFTQNELEHETRASYFVFVWGERYYFSCS